MRFGYRGPGSPKTRRRTVFRPTSEGLEDRKLLTTAVLGQIAPSPTYTSNVQEVGALAGDGAGFTVANVGDINGSGYDSFLISAPTITTPTATGVGLGTGTSRVFLVFGSQQVNNTEFDFSTLTAPTQTIGDLGTLGQANQLNPAVTQPTTGSRIGFDFDGVTFTTSSDLTSSLGASVAALGDINNDGLNDFAIGAPNDLNGGRVYIVYGGTNLNNQTAIDLNSGNTPTKVVVLASGTIGDEFGASVAGLGNFLTQGTIKDVGIGAPGTNSGAGAVYAIPGAVLNGTGSGTVIDVATVGVSGGTGVRFNGQANDRAGNALSTGGNFDGSVNGTNPIDSLLIGAPGPQGATTFASGRAYLVYGNQSATPATSVTTLAVNNTFNLSTVGAVPTTTLPNPLLGLTLNGQVAGRVGFAVNTAGDFNVDGIGDIMIGAPSAGFVGVIYGQAAASRPNGIFNFDPNARSSLLTQYFATAGSLFGYSITPVGAFSGFETGGIAIGAPGFQGSSGAAFFLPNTLAAPSTIPIDPNLLLVTSNVIRFTQTNSVSGSLPSLGTSVSARLPFVTPSRFAVDRGLSSLIIGAPGYGLNDPNAPGTTTRSLAGSAFAVFGERAIGAGTTPLFGFNPPLSIGGGNAPFTIDATSPDALSITVFSVPANAFQPAFQPFTQIDQQSIFVNGIAVPITNFASVADSNGDGVPEASFTISRALLNLVNGTTVTFSVAGFLNDGVTPFVGVTPVTISGGVTPPPPTPGGGGGSVALSPSVFQGIGTTYSGLYNGELVPDVRTLEHLNSYQPLPASVAYDQFLAKPGFRARQENFINPGKGKSKQAPAGTTFYDRFAKKETLHHNVRTRGKFKKGQSITFTHKVKVIPRNRQTDRYTSF